MSTVAKCAAKVPHDHHWWGHEDDEPLFCPGVTHPRPAFAIADQAWLDNLEQSTTRRMTMGDLAGDAWLDRARLWLVRRICPHVSRFERSTGLYCSTCLRRWLK